MPRDDRKQNIIAVEKLRPGRTCVCLFDFDRESSPPILPGLSKQFSIDVKEPLFRVLKECGQNPKIDLCLYTRGGHVHAVWPVVSLIREFDPDFEVLVPFACNSSGTLVALGARKIILTPISELSPIDPTGGNQFNPEDSINRGTRIGISVEDVAAYREFILKQFDISTEMLEKDEGSRKLVATFLSRLTEQVHPLSLGNIHRVQQQGRRLAKELLRLHDEENEDQIVDIVHQLSSKFFSHHHMINRYEARSLLGENKIVFADSELSSALDRLLRGYETDFALRRKFILNERFGKENEIETRFINGVVESKDWSYLYETSLRVRKVLNLPSNIQLQLGPGQTLAPRPGLPTKIEFELITEGWTRNTSPKGITT
ncbi:SDH family Clp fold serine proteinase [Lacunimicrobium album]